MEVVEREKDVIIKFKKSRDIPVFSMLGKVKSIRVSPLEVLDIDKSTGEFFVKETFTGSKMKMLGDSDSHKFDTRRLRNILELSKDFKEDDLGWLRE